MGTVPNNFPPESVIPVGGVAVGNALNLSATLATTTFFTAPTPGLYLVAYAIQIVSTTGAGSLTATLTTQNAGTVIETTPNGTNPAVAIQKDAAPAGPTDGYCAMIPVWLSAGGVIRAGVVAASFVGVYNVFVVAQRVF